MVVQEKNLYKKIILKSAFAVRALTQYGWNIAVGIVATGRSLAAIEGISTTEHALSDLTKSTF